LLVFSSEEFGCKSTAISLKMSNCHKIYKKVTKSFDKLRKTARKIQSLYLKEKSFVILNLETYRLNLALMQGKSLVIFLASFGKAAGKWIKKCLK